MATYPHDTMKAAKTDATSPIIQAPPYEDIPSQGPDNKESSARLVKSTGYNKRSWRAPVVIIGTGLAALAFALAHHFVNVFLDGRNVEDTSIKQAWVIRGQTMFAFVVRMFLTLCVVASFIQRQWYNFQRRLFTVHEIDAITAVMENPLAFRRISAWRKVPVLFVGALIAW